VWPRQRDGDAHGEIGKPTDVGVGVGSEGKRPRDDAERKAQIDAGEGDGAEVAMMAGDAGKLRRQRSERGPEGEGEGNRKEVGSE